MDDFEGATSQTSGRCTIMAQVEAYKRVRDEKTRPQAQSKSERGGVSEVGVGGHCQGSKVPSACFCVQVALRGWHENLGWTAG